jgi:hypothetical protein
MSRVHRIYCLATAALWVVILFLVFVVQPEPGPWRVMMYGLLALGAVLVPYCGYPYLLRGTVQRELNDAAALFLAGWEAAKAEEPEEPESVRHLSAV